MRLDIGNDALDGRDIGNVKSNRARGASDRAGGRFRAGDVDIGQHDVRALTRVALREGESDAARGTGDEGPLALKPLHRSACPSAPKRCSRAGSGVR